jgi:ribosome recycling factor
MDVKGFKKELNKVLESMVEDFGRIRTGRASPELIENVKVEVYGSEMTLKSIATVSVSDARSLVVQPWDKGTIEYILKGLISSDLGLSSSVEGDSIRVTIPELNEERRREYVKVMKDRAELARIAVRNARQKAIKDLPEGISEDEIKRLKDEIEDEVKKTNDKIAELRDNKEKELMTV